MNIKLRLTEEEELEPEASRGPTLEFVLENDEVFLKEEREGEVNWKQESQQQQVCTQAAENDRTEPCSADSFKTPNSNIGPDASP